MKQLLRLSFFVFLLVPFIVHADNEKNEKDEQANKVALEIVAALIEDIAKLVDNKKHEKDPQVTKAVCLSLVTHLADVIASVIIKIKERKETRSIDLYSQDEYQQALNALAIQLLEQSLQIQLENGTQLAI